MTRRALLTALSCALALMIASAASAFWSGAGSGAGAGTTGIAAPVTLSPGTPTATLYPGADGDVVLTLSNPNTSTVRVNSLVLDTSRGTQGFALDAAHAGCATTALSFTSQNNGGSGWTIPAKVGATNGALAVTLPHALTMALDAANACQGASTTVYLVARP